MPLCPAFPPPELQYIIDHSEALILVSSAKFADKARDVLKTDLAKRPVHMQLAKHLGHGLHEEVILDGGEAGKAGMMLYTSGTTSRPVRVSSSTLLSS